MEQMLENGDEIFGEVTWWVARSVEHDFIPDHTRELRFAMSRLITTFLSLPLSLTQTHTYTHTQTQGARELGREWVCVGERAKGNLCKYFHNAENSCKDWMWQRALRPPLGWKLIRLFSVWENLSIFCHNLNTQMGLRCDHLSTTHSVRKKNRN